MKDINTSIRQQQYVKNVSLRVESKSLSVHILTPTKSREYKLKMQVDRLDYAFLLVFHTE